MSDCTITRVHGRRVWGQPRPADRRGRGHAGRRIDRTRHRAGRCVARHAQDPRTARRRPVLRRAGRAARRRPSTARSRGVAGLAADDQAALDARLVALDGTPAKSRLGANATLAVSMAVAHAATPRRAACRCTDTSAATARRCCRCRRSRSSAAGRTRARRSTSGLHGRLPRRGELRRGASSARPGLSLRRRADARARGSLGGVADEGGWWPDFATSEQALQTLVDAIERAGFTPGNEVAIALDIAASEFGRGGRYRLRASSSASSMPTPGSNCCCAGSTRTRSPRSRTRWPRTTCTRSRASRGPPAPAADRRRRPARVRRRPGARGRGSRRGELRAAQAQPARHADRDALMRGQPLATPATPASSRRAPARPRTTIVHLAIGWQVGQLKVGSFARSERMAKWNEALRIEEQLGPAARFAGRGAFGATRLTTGPTGRAPRGAGRMDARPATRIQWRPSLCSRVEP